MTESARPRLAEQPSDGTSSAGGPPAGATRLWGSLFPASGSCGCSTGGVAPRPTTPARQSHPRMKRIAFENSKPVSQRSALETTDALPKNFSFGGNGLLFPIDRLFHRRFYIVAEVRTFSRKRKLLPVWTRWRKQVPRLTNCVEPSPFGPEPWAAIIRHSRGKAIG